MDKTTALSQAQKAALICYQWYSGSLTQAALADDQLIALQPFIGSSMSSAEMLKFGERIRQSKGFSNKNGPLIERWRHAMGSTQPPSETESLAFIQELFSSFDHSLIYDHSVVANTTHTLRGDISDRDKTFSGDMPCWTLHLTTRGKALFLNEQMELEVKPGDMMLLQPQAQYHYGLHPAADEWQHLWVLFQPRSHWGEWLNWRELDKGIMHLTIHDPEQRQCLEQLFKNLISLKDHPGASRADLQYNRLEELLIRAKENQPRSEHSPADQRIANACEYIMLHLASNFSVDDVAAACNLSASRIAHLFKQQMGMSLKAWSNNVRLQKVRKLLLSSNDSISAIARQVGYEDPAQLAKNFKKNMGCSPREFRQSFKQ